MVDSPHELQIPTQLCGEKTLPIKMIGDWRKNCPAKMIDEMIDAKMIDQKEKNLPTEMIDLK